jgi:folate-binding protein YgfZ
VNLDAFRQNAAIVDRSDRGKLHFTDERAFWFLDQLVTGKVEGLPAGEGVDALLLTPQGRITSVMRLISTGASVFADTEPGHGSMLREFFDGRVFTTRVAINDRTEDFGLVSVLGPRSDEIVRVALGEFAAQERPEARALGFQLPSEREHHSTHFGSTTIVRIVRPIEGLDLWVRREFTAAIVAGLQSAGGQLATSQDFGLLCTIEGLPRFGVDFDDGFLPQEAALERAVHFEKGCYLGQEAVAMVQRGQVKRRMRHLRFESDPLIGIVLYEGQSAGSVSSVATQGSSGFGIATIKTLVPVGAKVSVAANGRELQAEVLELPGTVAGPKVPSARELRERLRGAEPAR